MFACFHSFGRVFVCKEVLKIIDKGSANASAALFKTRGWILSGPGDLLILSFSSFS